MTVRRSLAAVLAVVPAVGAGAQQADLAAPGISRELAEHRARSLSDLEYDVTYRVPGSADDPIEGSIRIFLRLSEAGPIILDFADPGRIEAVALNGATADWQAHANHVVLPPVPAGAHEIDLAFRPADAPLNRRDDFLYTLFVPDRAHEALPGFDQPDLKARFALHLEVPAEWTAVANGPVVERTVDGDRASYRFAETEPIPTYLFAFAAGRFQVETAERAGRTMRLFHRETDSTKVARNVDALFDLHGDALEWLEAYTGIGYPFSKFDFVAIPSFQYNGMEHPGAILYRASSLFLDESATQNERLSRASVIAHETAHMWFGDLVTMRWFNDVWMKEVFANLLAAKIVNPSFPELDHELRFFLAHYPSAYGVDRTPGANPIRQPLENLDEAGALYGAIIYQKAPIVMRQLERLTGEEAFRDAIRRYLNAHPYGNAGWPALVRELDAATELDVSAWSRVWIEAAGRPHVTVHPSDMTEDGTRIVLRQSDPRGRGLRWDQIVDVGALSADSALLRPVRLRADTTSLLMPLGAPVLPNAAGLAYGLFDLDPESAQYLVRRLPGVRPAVARAAAWVDLWELMLEGGVAPDRLFDLAQRMVVVEEDELILQQVLGDLSTLYWRFLPPDARARAAGDLEAMLWREMLQAPTSSAKAAIYNTWGAVMLTDAAIERAAALWRGDVEIPGLPLSERDRTTLVLNLAVREAPGWADRLDEQRAAIDNPDRRDRFEFIRPAVSADPTVRDAFFESLRSAENRAREEWVATALSYLHHPLRAEDSRRYILPSLELLEEVRATGDIFFPTRWLAATLGGHSSPEAAAIVRAFIDGARLPPRLMEKLLQETDPLFRAVALNDGD